MLLLLFKIGIKTTARRKGSVLAWYNARLIGGIYFLEEMTHSPINNHASQLEIWERTPSYAPTPGFFGHERTPSRYCSSPNNTICGRSTPFTETQYGQINSLGEVGWDNESIYYVIEWNVTLNHRTLTTDTEQDLNQKPSSYWEKIKKTANDVVRQKKAVTSGWDVTIPWL